jgi:hypothetical protein
VRFQIAPLKVVEAISTAGGCRRCAMSAGSVRPPNGAVLDVWVRRACALVSQVVKAQG